LSWKTERSLCYNWRMWVVEALLARSSESWSLSQLPLPWLQKSALHKDATEQYKQLIRQAKANGFFLSQEQCVREIL
jgi:hypothetical protein